jgi:hypothetical protein
MLKVKKKIMALPATIQICNVAGSQPSWAAPMLQASSAAPGTMIMGQFQSDHRLASR